VKRIRKQGGKEEELKRFGWEFMNPIDVNQVAFDDFVGVKYVPHFLGSPPANASSCIAPSACDITSLNRCSIPLAINADSDMPLSRRCRPEAASPLFFIGVPRFSLRRRGALAKKWQFGNDEPMEEGDRGQEMALGLCIFDCNASEEERPGSGGSDRFD
jgi:hypothetical protein